jgi:heme exporter protein D
MEPALDITAVINAFVANGHFWSALVLTVLAVVIIPLARYWVNRENELQKNLAEARKKERDAELEKIKTEYRSDLSGIKEKIDSHEKRFEKGNSRFAQIETSMNTILVNIEKVNVSLEFIKERLK